ncbi:uncharacterized protein LOC134244100 [Saccostrea cucullata]|uniref:uncharacterized protein LOC134244100 n=1 Tax=Saccostrea cuccullata TaxID=36930 RepID=UPI002ED46E77
MAEGTPKIDPTIYSCPICLEKIITPKRLPCCHTFCEKCLQTFISRAAIGKDQENFDFECPVCRRVTGRPEPGIVVDEWAKYFPTNILVNSLTSSSAEKSEEKMCAICLRDDKKSKAESWCNDCAEAICPSCKQLHQLVGSLQKHKISTLRFDDKDYKPKYPDLDEPCHLHQGKYLEVFCLDHEALCCSVCFATQHRYCEHVEPLDEVSKNMSKLAIKGIIDVLSKISKITEETIEFKEKEIISKSAKREEIMKNVSTEISNIKIELDELQRQFEKGLQKKHEDIEERLKQCVFDLKQYLLTIKNGKVLLSAIEETGSSKQAFLSAAKTIRDVEEQFQHYKTKNPEDEVCDYEHDHTTILKQIFERSKIDDVKLPTKPSGTIWNLGKHLSSFDIFKTVQKAETSKVFENSSNSMSLTAVKKSEFELSSPSRLGIFLNEETLVMVLSPNTLLFCNPIDGTKIPCNPPLEVTGQPFLVVGPTNDTLYISCLTKIRKMKIRKKTNSGSASCVEEIDLKQDFGVFCVDKDESTIITASQVQVTIYKISPVLSVAHTFAFQSPVTGPILALSKTGDRFVILSANEEVICYSITGEERFRYQNLNMKSPRCLSFDPLNNIYAVYCKNKSCQNFYIQCTCRNLQFGMHNFGYDLNSDSYSVTIYGARHNRCQSYVQGNCQYCGQPPNAHLENGGLFQIMHDGSTGRCLISDYPGAIFLSFSQSYEDFFISNGKKISIYKLNC